MESELERFHKQNTGLELNIAELRLKLKATEKELYQERQMVCLDSLFNACVLIYGSILVILFWIC